MDPVLAAQELAEIPLFAGLSGEELERIAELLHRRIFRAGTLVMTAEQPGEAIYVILEGSLKVYLVREDGNEVILAILGPGQTVGEMSLLDSAGRSANAMTMEPTTLLWMAGTAFRRCLRTMPALSYNLLRLLCQRLRTVNEQILALTSLDVAGRVARQILALADQYGELDGAGGVSIPLRLTQGDLAAIVGTSREGVNRVMVKLKEREILSVSGKHHITVHHRGRLAALCR